MSRVVAQQRVVNSEQKRATAASDIRKTHFLDFARRLSLNEFTDSVVDDVAHDVFRRVIDAPGFANLGLLFDASAFVGGDDDFTEKPLVDAAENMYRDG